MKKITALFKDSYYELKNVSCITLSAMFGGITIILSYFTIMVGDFLRIGFSFLPNQFIYYLFGPVVGGIFGAAMDILAFIIKPTGPYFFGFTFNAILTGVIYGIILYKKPLKLSRILFANILVIIVVNMLLSTYWLSILYGKAFLVLFPMRALKSIIMLPIETILVYTTIKTVESSGILKILNKS